MYGVIELGHVPAQDGVFDGERGHGPDGGDGLGGDGGALGELGVDLRVHVGLDPDADVPRYDHGRQAREDADEPQLPRVRDGEDAAHHDADHGDQDDADVEAHQLEDCLRVRVDPAR